MESLTCARCMVPIAERMSRALGGNLASSLCWRCSRPAYHDAAGLA